MSSNEKIFREKSMEQLSAPEELSGYLRVTGPGVWVVLAGIIILLAGLLTWGVFGRIISTVTVPAVVSDGTVSCYVLSDSIDPNDPDIDITIGDVSLVADADDSKTVTLNASDDPALFRSGYLTPGKNAVVLTSNTSLADGFYDAVVTTVTLKPISLLFSRN